MPGECRPPLWHGFAAQTTGGLDGVSALSLSLGERVRNRVGNVIAGCNVVPRHEWHGFAARRTRGLRPRRRFRLVPLPCGRGVRVRVGNVIAWRMPPTPQWHGFAAQDTRTPSSMGFAAAARGRVTLERQSHQRPFSPLVRPPASGSLGSPVCPTARADGPSMAQRRSLGVLPRGLNKRAHLNEQQGATQPAAPRPVNRRRVHQAQRIALHCIAVTHPAYSGQRSGGLLTQSQPLTHLWRDQDCLTYTRAASAWLYRPKVSL